jgi:ribosomal protein L37AE/L43A
MAFRTSTMSSYNFDQSSGQWHLLRKLVLLFLLVVALALGLVILFRHKSDVPLLLFNVLADVSLGLIAGLGSRLVLRERNWFIQASASAAMAVIGLVVLGYFTSWKSGFGPLPFGAHGVNWLDLAHLPSQVALFFRRSQVDWLDLAHMSIAMDTSWIALRAWKQSAARVMEPSVRSSARVAEGWAPSRSSHVAAAPAVVVPSRAHSAGPRVKAARRRPGRLVSNPGGVAARPARSGRWNPLHRKPAVQLAVYEEHRCPYCLELVKRNDPRGVVECEVCHTLHHKDCWDITGNCQIPHLNT